MSKIILSKEERETLDRAYEILTRVGNETASRFSFLARDSYIDKAHHYLALVLHRHTMQKEEDARV